MVLTRTHGIDNTHDIELDSWYRIGTPDSHTYERAECYQYAGFFLLKKNSNLDLEFFINHNI